MSKEEVCMTFAEKLLNLRRARNWTQEELADKIGVTRQALSKWEANTALPDTKNVVAIARLFGVTTDYLLCEDEGREMEAGSTDAQKSPASRKDSTRVVLGVVLLVLGFCGVLAISISSIFAGTIMVPGSEYSAYLCGLSSIFHKYGELEWLFTFCILLCVFGLLLLAIPAIERFFEKINSDKP